jgi:predicted nucleic acid-binding protein
MKTAMQEAIKLVKKYDNREIPFKVLLLNLELLLNKEKEQMIDFAYGCTQHISREDIEEYYNQTYNQNK